MLPIYNIQTYCSRLNEPDISSLFVFMLRSVHWFGYGLSYGLQKHSARNYCLVSKLRVYLGICFLLEDKVDSKGNLLSQRAYETG
jgi:hypothetical protein